MNRLLQWVIIIGLQVVVLNHLDFSRFLVPQVFIVLLIQLPLHLSRNYQVLIAFALGLLVDLFTSTPGIHASGSLILIMVRMFLLSRMDLKEHAANKLDFSIRTAGLAPYTYVTLALVLIYHFYVFFLESIGAIVWSNLLLTTVLSAMLSLLIIALIQFITLRD